MYFRLTELPPWSCMVISLKCVQNKRNAFVHKASLFSPCGYTLWVVAEVNGDTKSHALKNQGVKIFG